MSHLSHPQQLFTGNWQSDAMQIAAEANDDQSEHDPNDPYVDYEPDETPIFVIWHFHVVGECTCCGPQYYRNCVSDTAYQTHVARWNQVHNSKTCGGKLVVTEDES